MITMTKADASGTGWNAERAASRKYGLEGVDEETGYYDLRASNGVRYQVKSCRHTRANGSPGRFRFWMDSFEKLHHEQSAAILVLTADSDAAPILKIEKMPTSTIREEIDGRWYASGHDDEMGQQYQLPWPDLLEY